MFFLDFSVSPPFDVKYKLIYTDESVCVRGGYSISAYDDNMIVIKCSGDTVSVEGDGLAVTYMSSDEIYISGTIINISFSRR